LKQIIAPVSGMQVHGHVKNRGKDLFQLAKRSPDWLKIKARPQQEFVVCGFTEEKGSRKHFGALLLGAYRNGKLRYFGHSGSGFTEKGLKETVDRLKPFFTDNHRSKIRPEFLKKSKG
jgi:bifunctional non-homologous end joining protein LigD